MAGQVAEVEVLPGPEPEHEERPEHQHRDDREHLDAGEPVLELAVGLHRHEVGRGHQHHQRERQHPQRRVDPERQDLGAGDGLEADHDHPEVPVEPGHREARPAAERPAGVVRERAGRRVRRRHLAEHPHHQDDQQPGDRVAEERRRPGLADHHARADEQAGADHAADRDHREVALLEPALQLAGVGHGGPSFPRARVAAGIRVRVPAVWPVTPPEQGCPGAHSPRRPRGQHRRGPHGLRARGHVRRLGGPVRAASRAARARPALREPGGARADREGGARHAARTGAGAAARRRAAGRRRQRPAQAAAVVGRAARRPADDVPPAAGVRRPGADVHDAGHGPGRAAGRAAAWSHRGAQPGGAGGGGGVRRDRGGLRVRAAGRPPRPLVRRPAARQQRGPPPGRDRARRGDRAHRRGLARRPATGDGAAGDAARRGARDAAGSPRTWCRGCGAGSGARSTPPAGAASGRTCCRWRDAQRRASRRSSTSATSASSATRTENTMPAGTSPAVLASAPSPITGIEMPM